ncbi:vitamin K epoxide reductase family protein [Parapedobacter sp. GCM10030251]|uniref:vitamin K epoxide reductase family protein n=1 Tax=Parapedobacter sp. GCM10030251 TaxID=3273419 RepID=UPI00360DE6B4
MFSLVKNLMYPSDNINDVAWHYARLLNLRVTRNTLYRSVDEHPDYPSMLALSDAFSEFGAETFAAKLTSEQLEQVNIPFITQIKLPDNHGEFFTVVNPKTDGSLEFFHPEKRIWETSTLNEFAEIFTGFVLVAEPREIAGEQDFAVKRKLEKNESRKKIGSFIFLSVLVLVFIGSTMFLERTQGILFSFYLLLFFSGIAITTLLLWYEVDQHNPALKKVCGSGGKKANCGAILNSKASNLFGVSWSLIGFTYFMGATLILVIGGLENAKFLQMVGWLSLLAVAYTGFSIYYQRWIARQWCRLCLYIQAVLVLQAVVATRAGWPFLPIDDLSIRDGVTLLLSFLFPFIVGQFSLSALKRARAGEAQGRELRRLKNNLPIFQSLLSKQKAITIDPSGLGITLGDASAKHKIIKVCNPYCGPCAIAHPIIEEIIHGNPDVQVQIIFTAGDDEKDIKAPPVKHLMAIAEKADESMLKRALGDWYNAEKKDYDFFAKKYPLNGELEKQGEKLAKMKKWCDETAVNVTPTFFVDGYQLPDVYSIKDLKYLLKA